MQLTVLRTHLLILHYCVIDFTAFVVRTRTIKVYAPLKPIIQQNIQK